MRRLRAFLFLAVTPLLLCSTATAQYEEPPLSRARVEAGELPPVDERLPRVPLIVSPVEQPGQYGGVWRQVLVGPSNQSVITRALAYEPLVRWDANWTRIVPNVASSWTVNADATRFTFRLRPGMRWSDGHPFTARDIVAWMDDVVRDPEVTPYPPNWLLAGGRLPECEALDEVTVAFRFAAPKALFLESLAGIRALEVTRYPAHYYRRIHRRHDAEGARRIQAETGETAWVMAFKHWWDPGDWDRVGIPTLDAWYLENPYTDGVGEVVARRNPYYWKVDTAGRQLPNLDEVRFTIVPTMEAALQRILAGEVDFQRQDFAALGPESARSLQRAEAAGRLKFVSVVPDRANALAICLNLTHPDPVMRAVLGDRRVRVALSEAIDRPRIITHLFGGAAVPWQVAPRPGSVFHLPRLGAAHTAFDPTAANAALDEAGLIRWDAEERRLLSDGRPFRVTLLIHQPVDPLWVKVLRQIREDWRNVGVELRWEAVSRSAGYGRIDRNEHDGAVFKGAGGIAAVLEPDYYVPVTVYDGNQSAFAMPWARWFNDPASEGAEAPPERVRAQLEVFRRLRAEPDWATRVSLMGQVLEQAADEFYTIGICLESSRHAVHTPRFRNVPASYFDSWLYPDPGSLNPCQFYLEPLSP